MRAVEHEAIIEELRLSRQSREDLHVFIREQTLRMERAAFAMERALERMGDRMEATLKDMGAQLRANTDAVLAVLDRLERGKA